MNFSCDRFLAFGESIPDSITSENELLSFLSQELPTLANTLALGKLEMTFYAISSPFEKGDEPHCTVLYQHPSGYEEFSLTDSYHYHKEAAVSYTFYPSKEHKWSEQEERLLHFLTHQLFLVSSRVLLINRVQKASITDPLTGILNTAGFIKQGTLICEAGNISDYVGLFLNIKGFRYINQRFTFKRGDDAMRKYTQRISKYLEANELFARLGCDNFALLIRKERLDALLEKLLSVRIHIQLDDFVNTFDISSRAGLYEIRPNDTMNDVLNRITVAGLLAKSSLHHHTIWFRDDMMERYIHDKEIADAFVPAIDENEFMVCYQPKVLLDNQTLCGCEALARWNRNGTILQPSEFVPVLEHEGTVCILDIYVLEKVCRDIRNWLDQGIEPVRISTNFSKIHLHNKNLSKDILRILDRYQIDPKYIEIELTESSGYEDFEALSYFINTMKENGVHTSIDDFGTGYSSLNLLTNLNIDTIKLDKSFLNQSETRSKSDEIVIKTIINMAKDLHMQVVCEGVETTEQATFLQSLHCPVVQGFLFDEPLPHDEFEQRLKMNRVYNKLA